MEASIDIESKTRNHTPVALKKVLPFKSVIEISTESNILHQTPSPKESKKFIDP